MSRTDRAENPGPHWTPGAPGSSTEARPERQMSRTGGLSSAQRQLLKKALNAKRRRRDREES